MILILTEKNDDHTAIVAHALREKGAEFVRFDTEDFPQQTSLAITMRGDGHEAFLWLDGKKIELSRVTTVWYRRPGMPVLPDGLSADDRDFVSKETTHFLRGLWGTLRDRFWVNRYDNSREGENKSYQLNVAQRVGFRVPQTFLGNNPDEARDFVEGISGDTVYKCFSQYSRKLGDRVHMIYTTRLNKKDLSRMSSVRLAPCIFQEYVEKKVELRVTVIGRKIFAAEIHSQQSARSREDWRRYDLANTPYYPHQLPREIEDQCHALLHELGLVFGCIDLILTPDGEYVFLEINPNGQWYWVESLTGMPMLNNFTEMLIQGTAGYADPVKELEPLAVTVRA